MSTSGGEQAVVSPALDKPECGWPECRQGCLLKLRDGRCELWARVVARYGHDPVKAAQAKEAERRV